MVVARYRDLCIDAVDPLRMGSFWAAVLGRTEEEADADQAVLRGPTRQHTVWINGVPEPKTVKQRVHLDIYATSIELLEGLGATVAREQPEGVKWTVMHDPEGGEFCAFLRDDLPGELLHGLAVDSRDAAAQADWWGEIYGAEVVQHADYFTVQGVPGMPILTMDFAPVPEPKTVKNRIHWDVNVADLRPLTDAGAVVVREPGGDRRWYVMADPEGNEFCAFVDE
jgi:hypothetical protein